MILKNKLNLSNKIGRFYNMNKRGSSIIFLLSVTVSLVLIPLYEPVPDAYALTPAEIKQKGYKVLIGWMIELAAKKAELAALKAKGPDYLGSFWGGIVNIFPGSTDQRAENEFNDEVKDLQAEIDKIQRRIDRMKGALDLGNTSIILEIIRLIKGINDVIDFSQAATMVYINLISAGGSVDFDAFISIMEAGKKGAEAVEDEDAATVIQDIIDTANAVKEGVDTVENLKDKIDKARDVLEGVEGAIEQIEEATGESLSAAPSQRATLVLVANGFSELHSYLIGSDLVGYDDSLDQVVANCGEGMVDDGSGNCIPVQCDTGYDLVGGECQEITCSAGYELVGNECVQSQTESTQQVTVLAIGEMYYPIAQFSEWKRVGECNDAWHYHTDFGYAINTEISSLGDPDPNQCGFGKTSEIPLTQVSMTDEEINIFESETGIDPLTNTVASST